MKDEMKAKLAAASAAPRAYLRWVVHLVSLGDNLPPNDDRP